jgi:predicted ATPase
MLTAGAVGASIAADDRVQQAPGLAHQQAALARELRAATGLARLRDNRAYTQEALLLVHARFTEGFSTRDCLNRSHYSIDADNATPYYNVSAS